MVYHVYIMVSRPRALYIGMTNHLESRVADHKQNLVPGFTSQYHVTRLVYFEPFNDVRDAIAREKQLKRWRREKKINLIERLNPNWRDLSEDFPH
jgi:putative endonuclease